MSWAEPGQFHIINVMRRMSQVHFEQVTSWLGAKLAHERFVTDYNAQPHWAHRKRDDHRLSPAEVLGQETWKLYGEGTLAHRPAVIWLHGDALTVEYHETPLAQYTVRYQPDQKHFKSIP